MQWEVLESLPSGCGSWIPSEGTTQATWANRWRAESEQTEQRRLEQQGEGWCQGSGELSRCSSRDQVSCLQHTDPSRNNGNPLKTGSVPKMASLEFCQTQHKNVAWPQISPRPHSAITQMHKFILNGHNPFPAQKAGKTFHDTFQTQFKWLYVSPRPRLLPQQWGVKKGRQYQVCLIVRFKWRRLESTETQDSLTH